MNVFSKSRLMILHCLCFCYTITHSNVNTLTSTFKSEKSTSLNFGKGEQIPVVMMEGSSNHSMLYIALLTVATHEDIHTYNIQRYYNMPSCKGLLSHFLLCYIILYSSCIIPALSIVLMDHDFNQPTLSAFLLKAGEKSGHLGVVVHHK